MNRVRNLVTTTKTYHAQEAGKCIGIDDVLAVPYLPSMGPSDAEEFEQLFRATYGYLHRRVNKCSKRERPLTQQAWGVLQHLAMTGPLTVREAAEHMNRAQSVASEIIDGLERKGLLARMRDERDRRRTLVWLTEAGHAALAEGSRVLSPERLERALARMSHREREALFSGLRALLHACATWREEEEP